MFHLVADVFTVLLGWLSQRQNCMLIDLSKHPVVDYVDCHERASPVCLSAAENKPIWMHAEEREEMSKVRPPSDPYHVTHLSKTLDKSTVQGRNSGVVLA